MTGMVPTVISQKSFWHNFMLLHSQSGFGDECGHPRLSLSAVGLVISAVFVGYTSRLPPGIIGYTEHLNLFVLCTPSACIKPMSPNVFHPLYFAEFVVESNICMPKAGNNYTDQLYVHRVMTFFECSSCSSRLTVPLFFFFFFFSSVDGIIVMQSNAKMILDTWKGVFFSIFVEIVHIDILRDAAENC